MKDVYETVAAVGLDVHRKFSPVTRRYRSSLVAVQMGTKNRLSGRLARHGIGHDFSDLFGVGGRRFLGTLSQEGRWEQGRLLPGAGKTLRRLLELLDHVRGQLAQIGGELHATLEATPRVKHLDGIPGIGRILAHTMRSEIGRIDRFREYRALGSYSLLSPRANDTGEAPEGRAPRGRHVGTRGNRTLKWAFLEAAHGAGKKRGKGKRIFDAATEGGWTNGHRGYIRVARELAKVVYGVWKKNVESTETPPERPGRERVAPRPEPARESAREFYRTPRWETGQPSRPMAVVP